MEEATVFFYQSNQRTKLPLYDIQLASEMVNVDISPGEYGFSIRIDDGEYELQIQPNGEGSGYTINLFWGQAHLDDALLSTNANPEF
ncbi:hypothetical protein HSB1_38970 [Halogranum salarium B-1]|uniref:Uncharacterized protein n=2 Tax=Halogranum rubrum TaxID=553466 RepID=J3JDS7_9EURY|nr:hypothetical protein HSB1_38970 [Halogranum salarium B-1]